MKILTQTSLFDQSQIEILGDLERLQLLIDNVPDEKLIEKLWKIRGKGRNDWPVVAMWHTFLASFVFQHKTVAELIRELKCKRIFKKEKTKNTTGRAENYRRYRSKNNSFSMWRSSRRQGKMDA